MSRVLLVDDDRAFTDATERLLSAEGLAVQSADSVAAARRILSDQSFDIQFVDLALPDGSGLELCGTEVPRTVIITGHPSVETAVKAVRGQVSDYLVKPVGRRELLAIIREPVTDAGDGHSTGRPARANGMVGESTPMRELYATIERYGPTGLTVLITGESGAGKELVARALHRARDPASQFVAINCGAIPQELLASELFGHERGSFTGASARRAGIFERAAGGTVFLDEVGELPLDQQVALLRVLEDRTITRVGGDKAIGIDAHVIAATNADLERKVADGEFREDLYFRLMVLPVTVPPLRERRDDIALLASHFLDRASEEHDVPGRFSDDVLERLCRYDWPGNVRELKHVVLRAAILSIGRAEVDRLPPDFERPPNWANSGRELAVGMSIKEVERRLIEKTLEHYGGNRQRTAEALGISLKTLYNRLTDYNSEPATP
ncbi:MAG: sigma-54 dependent transcriptional regulator [Pseudomonadota bacterium]